MPGERAHEAAIRAVLELVHTELDGRRQAISRELCSIPPPVPACDVNFNRLLDERARVVDELQALARLRASQADAGQVLAFCRASTGLDAASRATIEAQLRER